MLIPVGEEVAVPVTVVVLGPAPEVLCALLRRLDVDTLQVEISAGRPTLALRGSTPAAPPAIGTRLIVTAGDRVKLPGRMVGHDGHRWIVSREGARASDERAAPRFAARLGVRWRVAGPGQERWVAGGPDPGPFVEFRGPADLSLSGMCFACPSLVPAVGAQLLLDLLLEDHPDGSRHRALGAVRRIETAAGRTQIGVEFVDLPETTFDALSDYTLRNL